MDQVSLEVLDVLNSITKRIIQESPTCLELPREVQSEGSVDEDRRISLIQMPNGVYIFNQKDIRNVRTKERLLGTFCGPVQNMSNQSKLAPPLKLRMEEARLLLSANKARLVSVSAKETLPASEKIQALEHFQRKILEHSNRDRYREKLELLCLHASKKLKRQPLHPDHIPFNPTPYDRENPYTVQLVDTPFKIFEEITQLSYAKDPLSEMKFRIFSHLWRQGNFVTEGTIFSADFLVYKGDPTHYHAYGMVYCLAQENKLSALDIIRFCRIGSSVRKNIVIATISKGEVKCVTLSWEA